MKLLYIAYSCAPDRGSEDRIGWMLPLAAAQHHQVCVITKEEHRPEIEAYCKTQPVPIRFFYADIPAVWKKVLHGAAYSLRLNLWHRQALKLAKELCRREGIHLIHQITPVEFRSIGDYGAIPGVKFLCGPVGGGEYIPRTLWKYGRRQLPVEIARAALNRMARCRLKQRGILGRCDGLLFANRETETWLSPVLPEGLSLGICPEVGVSPATDSASAGSFREIIFLSASRLICRKGHALLLDALASLPEGYPWKLILAGEGPEKNRLKKQCRRLGLSDRITFLGKVPFSQMEEIYRTADVLVHPSLRETTGSVLAEAMSRGLPVITMNCFGGKNLVTRDTGWLYEASLSSLKDVMLEVLTHPEEIRRRGSCALDAMKQHTWQEKAARYQIIYETIMTREG